MRFHLVDGITAWYPGERAEGVKALSLTDAYVERAGLLPRAFMIEALAQLSSFLLGEAEARDGRKVLSLVTSVDQLQYHGDVRAGDRATLAVEVLARRPEGARVRGRVTGGDRLVAEGRLGFVFFAASSPEQAREFAWTYELLLALIRPGCLGTPPRREVFA